MKEKKFLVLFLAFALAATLGFATGISEEVTPTAAPDEPQYGGTLTTLTLNSPYDATSFDPAYVHFMANATNSPFQERLLIGDLSKGPRGENIYSFSAVKGIPDAAVKGLLAESWSIPDLNTIVFQIRKGVMFPDKPGVMEARELTAHDIEYSWDRFFEVGRYGGPRYDFIDEVTATDDYMVVFDLNAWNPDWMFVLGWGHYSTLVYPKELVDAGIDDWRNATGTGPFMLTDYVRGSAWTYERNPDYWQTDTIDGKEYQLPFVDKLVVPVIPDQAVEVAALQTGQVAQHLGVPWQYWDTLDRIPELNSSDRDGQPGWGVNMRMDNPELPFYDLNVRRAMIMAIDFPAVVDSIYGGAADWFNTPFPPSWSEALFTPLEQYPEEVQEMYSYNPEMAKQLLAEAGYPDGFTFEVVARVDPTAEDTLAMYADFWDDIGVTTDINMLENATWTSMQTAQSWSDTYHAGFGTGHPAYILKTRFLSDSLFNYSVWSDAWMDEQILKAEQITDVAEASAIFKEVHEYAVGQAPYVPTPAANTRVYWWPWVRNYYGEVAVGAGSYAAIHARIWIDEELKNELGH